MRYFIEFAYHGKNYFGYQKQPNAISVQETLEKALSLILKESIEIVGAGRTDAGVHAKQMYAHFNFDHEINESDLVKKLNSFLPSDIAIHQLIKVNDDAHARFDAINRTYEYHIHLKKNPFLENVSWYVHSSLDIQKMNEACKILMEYNDFECFSKVKTDVFTFNCKITYANWDIKEDRIIFTISADRFLRNMVRAIVGTMINIGSGKMEMLEIRKIIESKDRNKAGFSVPAHGLFLTKVDYPYI